MKNTSIPAYRALESYLTMKSLLVRFLKRVEGGGVLFNLILPLLSL